MEFVRGFTVVLSFAGAVGAPGHLAGQDAAAHTELARRALEAAGGVKPGEVVLIDGGIHVFPILEEIAAQVYMAGGQPMISIGTDRLGEVGINLASPEVFAARDSAFSDFYVAAYEAVDIHIILPFHAEIDDILRRAQADTARWRMLGGEGRERADRRLFQARDDSRVRMVEIDYPPRAEQVAKLPVAPEEYDRMMLAAVSVDSRTIDRVGRAFARSLERASRMRVTTARGTDIRVTLAGVPSVVRSPTIPPDMFDAPLAGQRTAKLPGGQISIALDIRSAEGQAAMRGARCGGEPLTNIRFIVSKGLLQEVRADRGAECANAYFRGASEEGRRLGGIHVGLNPAMTIIDEDDGFRPAIALGVVYLSFGFNRDIGGSIAVPESFGFPLVNPTIEVDGVVIMEAGRPILPMESPG